MKIEQLQESLTFIRDHIVTDENLTSVVGVVNKMAAFLTDIYTWLDHSQETESLNKEQTALLNSLQDATHPVAPALRTLMMTSDVTSREIKMPTITGIMDALDFIAAHLKSAGEMVTDIYHIFDSVKNAKEYQPDNTENQARSIRRLSQKDQDLYRELIA